MGYLLLGINTALAIVNAVTGSYNLLPINAVGIAFSLIIIEGDK